MKKMKAALICTILLLSFKIHSQDLPPLGSMPMFYNGGFAGEAGTPRLNVGTTINENWGAGKKHRQFYYSSFDMFIPKVRTGIGISAGYRSTKFPKDYSRFDDTKIIDNTAFLIASLSPKFSYRGKYTFAPFIDFTYVQNNNNFDEPSVNMGYGTNSRAGILFNSRKMYIGISIEIFESYMKDYTFIGSADRSLNSNIQLGYSFQKSSESKFSFTPQLVLGLTKYKNENLHFGLADLSIMFRYQKFIWGLNSNGIAFGFQGKKFKMVLSQSVGKNFYSGNLSLRYVFKQGKKTLY